MRNVYITELAQAGSNPCEPAERIGGISHLQTFSRTYRYGSQSFTLGSRRSNTDRRSGEEISATLRHGHRILLPM